MRSCSDGWSRQRDRSVVPGTDKRCQCRVTLKVNRETGSAHGCRFRYAHASRSRGTSLAARIMAPPPGVTVTASLLVWNLMAPVVMMTAEAAPQANAIDPIPPTTIERALVDRGCNSPALIASADADARQRCADAQLALLRGDFGVNLKRV